MDSCLGVEQDLDKAISKFNSLNDNTNKAFQDIIDQVENLRKAIAKQPNNTSLTPAQSMIVSDLASSVKQSVFQLSTDHRELHATVSRVGKSIDRHFVADYAAVAPKAETFCSDKNRPLMEQAIAQHLYRQGLEEVGDTFVSEANVTGVERTCTFATLQRCAAALTEGDPSLALEWVKERVPQLQHSPLPFTLHRMQALKVFLNVPFIESLQKEYARKILQQKSPHQEKRIRLPSVIWMNLIELARTAGVGAAIEYARREFPAHAVRHERALAAAVCALAWCSPSAPPPPHNYEHLLSERELGAEAAELFIRESCLLLKLAPLSPLAGAVAAGTKVLPVLHDIRAKMSHPHVIAAWSEDELPFEVDLGEDGGSYHSVFACPILRQQASDTNPPMRLLCGHVISRDALNKLALGSKLKCPYCPMEQSPGEARQIYFS